ncbi:MAG: hypothetical protein SGARI_005926, partial [Bacillariaceae sp.]
MSSNRKRKTMETTAATPSSPDNKAAISYEEAASCLKDIVYQYYCERWRQKQQTQQQERNIMIIIDESDTQIVLDLCREQPSLATEPVKIRYGNPCNLATEATPLAFLLNFNASADAIQKYCIAFPEALKLDCFNNLALWRACDGRKTAPGVIATMVRTYPESVLVKDRKSYSDTVFERLIIAIRSSPGHLDDVKAVVESLESLGKLERTHEQEIMFVEAFQHRSDHFQQDGIMQYLAERCPKMERLYGARRFHYIDPEIDMTPTVALVVPRLVEMTVTVDWKLRKESWMHLMEVLASSSIETMKITMG